MHGMSEIKLRRLILYQNLSKIIPSLNKVSIAQKKNKQKQTSQNKIKELKPVLLHTHFFYTSIIDWNM